MKDASFAVLQNKYLKMHLIKLDCSFCIVRVCSELQQVFIYMEYLKSFSIIIL